MTFVERRRRYAVLGTGSIGGFYGGLLARAGFDVHFLARGDWEVIRRDGLIVESKHGDFVIPNAQAHGSAEAMPACDVALVCWKTTANAALAPALRHALAPDGVVVMMQNGLGVEDVAVEVVGPDRVIGGLCFVYCNKLGPGRIRHLDYGLMSMGAYAAGGQARGVTPTLQAIADDFRAAGVTVRLDDDLISARWHKLVWNVPFSGLSVALDATTDELLADPDSLALLKQLMDEVALGARACGRTIAESFRRQMVEDTTKVVPYRASMKVDYDRGDPMEVEAIFGAPARASAAAGQPLPAIETLYRQLQFLDARNRRRRAMPISG